MQQIIDYCIYEELYPRRKEHFGPPPHSLRKITLSFDPGAQTSADFARVACLLLLLAGWMNYTFTEKPFDHALQPTRFVVDELAPMQDRRTYFVIIRDATSGATASIICGMDCN